MRGWGEAEAELRLERALLAPLRRFARRRRPAMGASRATRLVRRRQLRPQRTSSPSQSPSRSPGWPPATRPHAADRRQGATPAPPPRRRFAAQRFAALELTADHAVDAASRSSGSRSRPGSRPGSRRACARRARRRAEARGGVRGGVRGEAAQARGPRPDKTLSGGGGVARSARAPAREEAALADARVRLCWAVIVVGGGCAPRSVPELRSRSVPALVGLYPSALREEGSGGRSVA